MTTPMTTCDGTDEDSFDSALSHNAILTLPAGHELAPLLSEAPCRRRDIKDIFTFEAVLREGRFGKVWRAVHNDSGNLFAIKEVRICSAAAAGDAAGRGRGRPAEEVVGEARAMERLRHRNVVRLWGLYLTKLKAFQVVEWSGEMDLFEALREVNPDGFSERDVAHVMQQVLCGVSYMHCQGVCHRDIRPENLLLDGPDLQACDLKIADLGSSWAFSFPDERSSARAGAVPYMSPEMLLGSYTHMCDNWSCGVVAYLILAGAYPFHGEEAAGRATLSFDGSGIDAASAAARAFLCALLQKSPEDRRSAADALRDPWIEHHATNAPADALPRSVLDSLRRMGEETAVRSAVANAVAGRLSRDEVAKLRECLARLDATGAGSVSYAELAEALAVVDVHVEEVLGCVGLHGERVDYRELLATCAERRRYVVESHAMDIFLAYDADGSCEIPRGDVRRVLANPAMLGLLRREGASVDGVVGELHASCCDTVLFDEFYAKLHVEAEA